ncbi:hypothetical protein QUF76_00580 [Desulfobacterales bacterium HSG16]|nr:hypothetical protein [Desulfobacterales bacterium HSG16]
MEEKIKHTDKMLGRSIRLKNGKKADRKLIMEMPVSSDPYYGLFYPLPIIFVFLLSGIGGIAISVISNFYFHDIMSWQVLCFIVIFMSFAVWLLRTLFREILIVEEERIVHKGPKVDGSKEKIFKISRFESILWKYKKNPDSPVSYELHFIDKTGLPQVLFDKHGICLMSLYEWDFFLRRLSKAADLPVNMEFYASDGSLELKKNMKSVADEKWKFLPRTAKMIFRNKK